MFVKYTLNCIPFVLYVAFRSYWAAIFFSFVHDNFTLLSTQFLLLFRFKYVSPVRLNVNLFVEAFFVALSFDDGDGYGSCEKLDDDGSVMIFY